MMILSQVVTIIRHIATTWGMLSKNWLIALVNKFILFFVFLSLAVLILRWQLLPPKVPLWYSKPWGTDQLADPVFLFILPVGSIAIYIINILVSVYLTAEYLVFTQILALAAFLVSLLSFVTLVKILFVIT